MTFDHSMIATINWLFQCLRYTTFTNANGDQVTCCKRKKSDLSSVISWARINEPSGIFLLQRKLKRLKKLKFYSSTSKIKKNKYLLGNINILELNWI